MPLAHRCAEPYGAGPERCRACANVSRGTVHTCRLLEASSDAMRCAAALAEGPVIEPHQLPEEIVRPASPAPAGVPLRTLAEVEQEHVLAVLRACHGVQAN